jgi:biopolymer transport protein ExbD
LTGVGDEDPGLGARPEINITPLVDVVLVWLIIFMVVTPMMESGLAMDFPKAPIPRRTPGAWTRR